MTIILSVIFLQFVTICQTTKGKMASQVKIKYFI